MKEIRREKVNTNNAWGFGGKIGTYIDYDNGLSIFNGRNCHRHSGTSSANCLYVEAVDDFDVVVYTTTEGRKEVSKMPPPGTVISVLNKDDNYFAVIGDYEELIKYGDWVYKRVKKILID